MGIYLVYIKQSMHVPLPSSVLPDAMETFFKLLVQEKSAAVWAILGHFLFVYIHPYSDGNGRISRFLMNCMLASGGYPWCIIPLDKRGQYMAALETASYKGDIKAFTLFVRDVLEGEGR
jgi:Fic family protein